jgi:hypothetical protein
MATPTTYSLTYQTPCEEEQGCGVGDCLGKVRFEARPYNFCEDVTLLMDLTVNGNVTIIPAQITVGGQTFTPKTVIGLNGTFICLAV